MTNVDELGLTAVGTLEAGLPKSAPHLVLIFYVGRSVIGAVHNYCCVFTTYHSQLDVVMLHTNINRNST